ncbi:hypothetical protein D3C87_1771990 [compost metagenome]
MIRQIQTDTPAPVQQTPVAAVSEAAVTAAIQAEGEKRDALAGALPAWDLLPATPFVRRIK